MRPSVRVLQRLLLPAAVVLATASCGVRALHTSVPAASGPPGGTGSPVRSAKSAAPSAAARRPPAGTAVIFGVVLASPACPVDRVYHACHPRPIGGAEVQARTAIAGVVATARTGTDGRFTLRIKPGSYLLVVRTPQVFPRCPRALVTLGSGATVRTHINCDIGLRQFSPAST